MIQGSKQGGWGATSLSMFCRVHTVVYGLQIHGFNFNSHLQTLEHWSMHKPNCLSRNSMKLLSFLLPSRNNTQRHQCQHYRNPIGWTLGIQLPKHQCVHYPATAQCLTMAESQYVEAQKCLDGRRPGICQNTICQWYPTKYSDSKYASKNYLH